MSTRQTTLVIDREYAKEHTEGFAINPEEVIEHSYVNMYLHHDGYLEWQGVQLANWIKWHFHELSGYNKNDGAKIASQLASQPSTDSIKNSFVAQLWSLIFSEKRAKKMTDTRAKCYFWKSISPL